MKNFFARTLIGLVKLLKGLFIIVAIVTIIAGSVFAYLYFDTSSKLVRAEEKIHNLEFVDGSVVYNSSDSGGIITINPNYWKIYPSITDDTSVNFEDKFSKDDYLAFDERFGLVKVQFEDVITTRDGKLFYVIPYDADGSICYLSK